MNRKSIRLLIALTFAVGLLPATSSMAGDVASTSQVVVTSLAHTTHAWDGSQYTHYPQGIPQIDVQRVYIPAHTTLPWHTHAIVNAVYLLSGSLTVEKRNGEGRRTFKAGSVIADVVDVVHHGFTTDEPAEMIVFFAAAQGLPLRTLVKN